MNSYELTPDFFENLKNHSLKAESKKWGFRLKVHVREYAKTAFALTTSPQRTESNYIAYGYRGGQSLIIFDSKHSAENEKMTELRIRKLTPLEYWRLMGFDDSDFQKVKESGMSNTQLYKQAGNSIVVNVAEALFKELEEAQLLEVSEHA